MELTQMTREIIQQFRTLSAIPHPSGREAGLAHALAEIFQSMGGTVQTDALWNLRCDFPATAGLEQAPCVCIQGHLDMVCATAPGSHYHPDQDGIVCRTEDGWQKSDGRSSLGADNLLAGSAALWLLRQRFRHGPIRLLFTTREERALDGAKALDPRWLDGVHYLINTDGFQENRIIVGSAGGCYQIWTRTMETAPDPRPAYRVALSGFPGGHSGSDIGKGRINPLRLLAALLAETDADIAALTGGSAMNAIPSEAAAVVVPKDLDRFRKALDRVPQLGGAVALTPLAEPVAVWTPVDRQSALDFLLTLPNGVLAWLPEWPKVPACSANLGKVEWKPGVLTCHLFLRGAPQEALDRTARGCHLIADRCGFALSQEVGYPPWDGVADNPLARRISALWAKRNGTPMEITPVHEGLEPSRLIPKHPDICAVIIGTTILDAHSTHERASLEAIPHFVHLLKDTLEEIALHG